MPSEYQKKKLAKKKELAKQKGGKKAKEDTPDSDLSGTATPRYEIFVFFHLSFSQKERKMY